MSSSAHGRSWQRVGAERRREGEPSVLYRRPDEPSRLIAPPRRAAHGRRASVTADFFDVLRQRPASAAFPHGRRPAGESRTSIWQTAGGDRASSGSARCDDTPFDHHRRMSRGDLDADSAPMNIGRGVQVGDRVFALSLATIQKRISPSSQRPEEHAGGPTKTRIHVASPSEASPAVLIALSRGAGAAHRCQRGLLLARRRAKELLCGARRDVRVSCASH